jgi:hypothetical protein
MSEDAEQSRELPATKPDEGTVEELADPPGGPSTEDSGESSTERKAEAAAEQSLEDSAEMREEEAVEAPGGKKADPELLRQLEESEARSVSAAPEEVQAVFVLGGASDPSSVSLGGARPLPSPDETEKIVRRVVERVQGETGKRVELLNVFRNMNSFVVAGDPVAIRSLLEQPEIASAVANRQPGTIELLEKPGSTAS